MRLEVRKNVVIVVPMSYFATERLKEARGHGFTKRAYERLSA